MTVPSAHTMHSVIAVIRSIRGNAPSYSDGHAEEVYGAVIPAFRKEIFLTTKSGQRTRKGAEADLETSLRSMKTDHVDLWQMHNVARMQDVEQIFAPGGAIEAFEEAKKAGKCRFIGYSNCRDPEVHVAMLRHAERFDTALMPLHVADTCFSDSPKMSFEQTALPAAVERGVGIFAIKVFGNAFLLRTFSVFQNAAVHHHEQSGGHGAVGGLFM